MRRLLIIAFTIGFSYQLFSQNDTLPYELYKERVVLHTSLGYRNAPFQIKGPFGDFDKLKYRPNLNLIQGIGIAYKWFSLNINYKLPGQLRNSEKYGETKYFDLKIKFNLKKWHFKIDFHNYSGFGIKDAQRVSDTIPLTNSGYHLKKGVSSSLFGINAYQFLNGAIKMKPATGISGRYTHEVHGLYIRYTTTIFGLSSNKSGILPYKYFTSDPSVHTANNINAIETGAIPGYAYLNNWDGWQIGVFGGLGAVIQAKGYFYGNQNRGFLGLAPRVDLHLQAGWNVENWFLMLTSSFDHKSIRFANFQYRQIYYNVQLTYGFRFQ